MFAILALSSSVFAIEKLGSTARYNLRDIKVHLSYVKGGTTRLALEDKYQQQGLLRATPGGYFNPESNPLVNVDYTFKSGRLLVSYIQKKRRPVIFFSKERVARIAWPSKHGGISRHADELEGIAGDDKAQKPNRPLCRTIIGLTKSTLTVFHVRGTEAQCFAYMRNQGYKREQWLFMDGGDSTLPTTVMPSHILVFKRTR